MVWPGDTNLGGLIAICSEGSSRSSHSDCEARRGADLGAEQHFQDRKSAKVPLFAVSSSPFAPLPLNMHHICAVGSVFLERRIWSSMWPVLHETSDSLQSADEGSLRFTLCSLHGLSPSRLWVGSNGHSLLTTVPERWLCQLPVTQTTSPQSAKAPVVHGCGLWVRKFHEHQRYSLNVFWRNCQPGAHNGS